MPASRARSGPFLASLMLAAGLLGLGERPADAAITAVKGSACGYYARIAVDGGQSLRGCGQPSAAPATAASPSVTLPAGGSATAITAADSNGAKAVFDTKTFFGGQWPEDVASPPPSGPLTVSTQGTPGEGTVTSSADIALSPSPLPVRCLYGDPGTTDCEAPGGFGPSPVQGDALHVDCRASEISVTATTQVVNGLLVTATDEYGSPLESEVVPTSPPVNYTRSGVISNPSRNPDTPGDILTFSVVFNQHIFNSDGSLTVNGVHIYLFGPMAVGEVVEGQATCGTTPYPAVPADAAAPTCGIPVVLPWGPEDPSPSQPLTELIGAFDAGGLQSITNIRAINATVQVGQPGSFAYLKFSPGQTTPLKITATRTQDAENANLPIYWSFDAVDKAGNITHCRGIESPPEARDDSYSTSENLPLNVPAPGVLANDLPAGGDLVAAVATNPANGTLALNANGSFTYTPDADFSGADAFTYTANDGTTESNAATVALTVSRINDPPSCADASIRTDEDVPGTVGAPCTDSDGDALTHTIVGQGDHGSASVVAGDLTYIPNANFAGTDAFTYRANDGNGSSEVATVAVTVDPVNDAPVAVDDAYATSEDVPLTLSTGGVLANDADVEGDTLAAGAPTQPTNGMVTLDADGSFTYTPNVNFNGTDTFTYTVNDGQGGTDVGVVTITIAAVNDAPAAGDDAYTTPAGTPLSATPPGVLGNDTDVDGDTLSAGSAGDPPNGVVALNADGSFLYTPDTGFSGIDTFTYTTSDGSGGSDVATVTITVATPPPPTGPTTLSVSDLSVSEGNTGTGTATFTVTRSGSTAGSSSVKYKTSGGTATGTDYSAVTLLTTLSFAAGESSKQVDVPVTGDILPEANETFNLVLSAPAGASIADASGTATIVNDDGSAYLSVSSVTVTENNSGSTAAVFTITRSGNTNGISTVKAKTSGGTATAGTDYTAITTLATLSFAPGETSQSVSVDVMGDTLDEANETFNLVLSGSSAGTVVSDASGAATIVDDEGTIVAGPATFVSVGDLSVAEGAAGVTTATFSVTRSGTTSGASTVKYRTSGGTATAGSDYTAVTTLVVLRFAAGETTKTVTVDVTGDPLPEASETFNLVLSAPTAATIADASGTATILNDDGSAYVAVGDIAVNEGSTGTTAATFTLTRSGTTTGPSTVTVKTAGGTATAGTDYHSVGPTPVTFDPGETTRTVTVDVTGDTDVEANETLILVLSAPVGVTISDTSGTATIANDD